MSDHEEFKIYARVVQAAAQEFLLAYFGRRCDEYDENCECCRRWKLLNELLENPFDE